MGATAVTVYLTDPNWVDRVAAQRRRWPEVQGVHFVAALYPADGQVQRPAVVIRPAGGSPVETLANFALAGPMEIAELSPQLVHAAAVNRRLDGQTIPIGLAVVEVFDQAGQRYVAILL